MAFLNTPTSAILHSCIHIRTFYFFFRCTTKLEFLQPIHGVDCPVGCNIYIFRCESRQKKNDGIDFVKRLIWTHRWYGFAGNLSHWISHDRMCTAKIRVPGIKNESAGVKCQWKISRRHVCTGQPITLMSIKHSLTHRRTPFHRI